MRRTSSGKALAGLAILFLAATAAQAQTVEVVPTADTGGAASGGSTLVATGCMRTLFEGGCIVSDERPRVLDAAAWANIALGVKDAEEGFADFVFSFHIEWLPSAIVPGSYWPVSVRYRVVRVADLGLVFEGALAAPPDEVAAHRSYDAVMDALGVSVGKAFLAAVGRSGLARGVHSESIRLGGYL